MTRKSGWRDAQRSRLAGTIHAPLILPDRPAFDEVLSRVGVGPAEAPQHPLVRVWIKHNYRSKYVPESILEALGISLESVCP